MATEPYGYHARPDGRGGVTLVPNAPLQATIDAHYRTRTRDAGFKLPGAKATARQMVSGKPIGAGDGDPGSEIDPSAADPSGGPRGDVIATLDPPAEGYTYQIEANPDGSFAVLQVPADDEDEIAEAAGDRSGYHHDLSGTADARLLAAMNRVNRRRAAGTRDAEVRHTLFRHTPLPDQRVELKKNSDGSVDVVLVSDVPDDVYGRTPLGSTGDFPATRSTNQRPSATGDRRASTTADRLTAMNDANRRFWARRA